VYNVHVKRVTASEARRNWFRLLDEVAAGARIVIERGGRRIVLQRDPEDAPDVPDYRSIIRAGEAVDVSRAHLWGWEWSGEESELELIDREPPEED
jgi:antitoxin (DNA-binding transcriptional repressor) of toxin-antitoxin stability system